MPEFRLRKIPDEENAYCVMLQLEDGYELRIGAVREHVGSGMHRFWSWSIGVMRPVLGRFGQAETREEAMERFRAAWESIATADDIAEIRRDAEWTDQKYALWAAGKRDEMADGAVHCPCGETFDPRDFEATKAHIGHITARDD
jgi:hypothetical protein